MSEQEKEDCSEDIKNMRKLLYGDPVTGRGGLAQIVDTMATTLYGSERIPGGLVSDVSQMKKFLFAAGGAVTVLQVVIQIIFHFWPK